MKFDKDLLLHFLLISAIVIQRSHETMSVDPYTGTHKYCGKNLVHVLTMVCDGIYNHKMLTKDGAIDPNTLANLQIPQLRDKRSIVTIFQRSDHHRRHRRGAYDECCKKGCSLDEMVGYCGNK